MFPNELFSHKCDVTRRINLTVKWITLNRLHTSANCEYSKINNLLLCSVVTSQARCRRQRWGNFDGTQQSYLCNVWIVWCILIFRSVIRKKTQNRKLVKPFSLTLHTIMKTVDHLTKIIENNTWIILETKSHMLTETSIIKNSYDVNRSYLNHTDCLKRSGLTEAAIVLSQKCAFELAVRFK